MSNEVAIGIAGLFVLLAVFLTGIEIGFAMAIIGFLGFGYIVSMEAALNILARDFVEVFSSYGYTMIPLFVLMGQLAHHARISRKLYDTADKFIGHVSGGLAMATVLGAVVFKMLCGSAVATAATFASIAVPEMRKYRYNDKLSAGIVASVGGLGCLIPPSVSLIIYGLITEESIGRLFLAGIIPGLILALFFALIIFAWCRINPNIGPKGVKSTWEERWRSLPVVIWPVLIFAVVLGGLIKGFFTPTESASIGAFAVFLFSVLRKDMGFKEIVRSIADSFRTSIMLFMIIAGSTVFGHFLIVTKIPLIAADWVAGLALPRFLIVILILLIYQLGGSFMDDLAFMVLATPIFFPIIVKLGYDPIWFGIMIGINLIIGVVIPPVAANVFAVRTVTGLPFGVIYSGVYPFLIAMVICGILIFIFPQIALFLPRILMG